MADLTIVAAQVAPVVVFQQVTGPCAEAIDAGEVVRLDTTSGYFTLANATVAAEARAIGIAIESGVANQPITVVVKGIIDVGDALTAEALDEILELSNNDGKIDDTLGGTIAKAVGRVWPAFGATAVDKLLYVDFDINAA